MNQEEKKIVVAKKNYAKKKGYSKMILQHIQR